MVGAPKHIPRRERPLTTPVLINNAGILGLPEDTSLASLRKSFDRVLSVNLTSCALIAHAFAPLLHAAAAPRVINITSGLGSIQNALTMKMPRVPTYGGSKIGMNGATIHQQMMESDRVADEKERGEDSRKSYIK